MVYGCGMAKQRSLTKLELVPATVGSAEDRRGGWVEARWRRADGSKGDVAVRLRPEKAEHWYPAQLLLTLPTNAKLRDIPLARIESAANADPAIIEWAKKGSDPETVEAVEHAAARRPKLKRPRGRRLDDGFYKQVAAAYTGAVANGLDPVKTLAADSDTPQGTIARWIAQARARDYLPQGRPGKATV
jgi:hypothetical protein